MVRIVNVTAKMRTIFNPLPAVSEEEIFETAESYRTGENKPAFRVVYNYAAGDPNLSQTITWDPQTAIEVRPEDAEVMLRTLKRYGLVELTDPTNEGQSKNEALAGLRVALAHYRSVGQKKVDDFQIKGGYTDIQVKSYRQILDTYYINEVKANAIEAEIKRLTAKKKEKAA